MKVNDMLKIAFLSFCLLLVGCASSGNGASSTDGAQVSDASSADKTSSTGIGTDESFASSDDSSGNVNKMEVGNQTYYFDYDKSDLHADDRPSVQVQARYLAAHPNAKILLEGHTDPRGSREYNIALGERRAKAVADILKLEGVNKNQIRIVSYGAEKLASQGQTEEDYQQDRRVNLIFEAK